jgi:hypothetical protein
LEQLPAELHTDRFDHAVKFFQLDRLLSPFILYNTTLWKICPYAFDAIKDVEDFHQRIPSLSIGGVMILRQLGAAIVRVKSILAIAASTFFLQFSKH